MNVNRLNDMSGEFNSDALEKLAEEVMHDLHAREPIIIDLSAYSFMHLSALTKLVALLYSIYREKAPGYGSPTVSLIPPFPHSGALDFMYKMRFFNLVAYDEVFIGANLEAKKEKEAVAKSSKGRKPSQKPYMSFERIVQTTRGRPSRAVVESETIVFNNRLMDAFADALLHHLHYYDRTKRAHFELINKEVYENIHMHSGSWGYASIQCLTNGMLLCYGDIGLGFSGTLGRFRDQICDKLSRPWNDRTAIVAGFERGITSQPGVSFGLGLDRVKMFVGKAKGIIECRSGRGRVIFHPEGEPKEHNVENISGVQMIIFLPVR